MSDFRTLLEADRRAERRLPWREAGVFVLVAGALFLWWYSACASC